jgi:hypothetical protein
VRIIQVPNSNKDENIQIKYKDGKQMMSYRRKEEQVVGWRGLS